jgi:hypothetical protein
MSGAEEEMMLRVSGICVFLAAVLPAAASEITYIKIADTETPIPGGIGTFTNFTYSAIDAGCVAFSGGGVSGQYGCYFYDGGLSVVADRNTLIPGSSETFAGWFRSPAVDGANVVFNEDSGTPYGIYARMNGALWCIADNETFMPGGGGHFNVFNHPTIGDWTVVFQGGNGNNQDGIYTYTGGVLDVLANRNTWVPGGPGDFRDFGNPAMDAGNIAFEVDLEGVGHGVFKHVDGQLSRVVDTDTEIPGGLGTFRYVGLPSICGADVVFKGIGEADRGIYSEIDGALGVVADTNTPVPDWYGTFTDFYGCAFDSGVAAFHGGTPAHHGIYATVGGSLTSIIDRTIPLDGKTISSFDFSDNEGLSGDEIVFIATFNDGSKGVYVAVIPEPACAALLMFGGIILLRRRQAKVSSAGS